MDDIEGVGTNSFEPLSQCSDSICSYVLFFLMMRLGKNCEIRRITGGESKSDPTGSYLGFASL